MCLEGPADLKRALFLLALTLGGEPLVRKLGMILHSHTAEKQAVSVKGAQELGNPLRLRRALGVGVTVVMVHCASLGRSEDLDHPGRRLRSFELFQRLMGEARCRDHPSGALVASTQIKRPPGQFRELLRRPELQERLLQGSAYPLSGVDLVIWTTPFRGLRRITAQERLALNELDQANPLLFDFVLKRILRDPKMGQALSGQDFTRVPEPPHFSVR